MGRRIIGAEQQSAFTGWRRADPWKPGRRRKIKRRAGKLERRLADREIQRAARED